MLKKVLFTTLAALSIQGIANAQQSCHTDSKYWNTVKQHPEILEYEQEFEQQIRAQIDASFLKNHLGKTTAASDTTTYDVPIVIHIVHDYGAEYLPDTSIYTAVAYWADVFMARNADTSETILPFKRYVGNPKIRLHLATKDPNGLPTKGVVRHVSYLTSNGDDQAKYHQWPNNKYINFWFIRQFGASATGAAAYAYYPSSAAAMPQYDGVIGLYNYLNYDKAIPHEIGHVLNLQHVWGNNNNPEVACGNDLVDDTPPTKGHMPSGCTAAALYDTTCSTGYLKVYTVAGVDSIVNYPDTNNSQNIMDYTYCQRMFTKGQCVRMRTALTSSTAGRNNLITAANLSSTGALQSMPDLPPTAEFSVDKAVGGGIVTDAHTRFLAQNSVNSFVFRNRSWNDTVTNVNWSFSNGATTPTSTSMTNVNNKFTIPGWVTVTLTATSNAGTGTIVDDKAVYVADSNTISTGFVQDFNSLTDMANWPMINFYRNPFRWEFVNGAGYGGSTSCVRYRSFDTSDRVFGTALGDYDDLHTPAYNLEGITGNYYLNFFTAASRVSSTSLGWGTSAQGDSLEIDASINGGGRWFKIAGFNSSQLVNNGTRSTEFTPSSASNWAARAINIPETYRKKQTFFRFRYYPGNIGNNMYMDKVSVGMWPAEVQDLAYNNVDFKLFPNPTDNGANLVFNTGADGNVTYTVKDITGKILFTATKKYSPDTVVSEFISKEITPVSGLYLVTLVVNNNSLTQKLLVY